MLFQTWRCIFEELPGHYFPCCAQNQNNLVLTDLVTMVESSLEGKISECTWNLAPNSHWTLLLYFYGAIAPFLKLKCTSLLSLKLHKKAIGVLFKISPIVFHRRRKKHRVTEFFIPWIFSWRLMILFSQLLTDHPWRWFYSQWLLRVSASPGR